MVPRPAGSGRRLRYGAGPRATEPPMPRRSARPGLLPGLLLALAGLLVFAAAPPPELGRRGLVASDHALASEAGAQVLAAGGNAVDAAVATALAAGVVQPAGSGLGGGGFAVVVEPDGERHVLDFREVAPAAAHRDLFVEAAAEDASQKGGLAVAVPAEGLGLVELHARWGRLPLSRVARPAQELARRGFPVGAHLAAALTARGDRAGAVSAGLFGGSVAAGAVPRRGDLVRRQALGRTIGRLVSSRGADLRSGSTARDVVAAVQAAGGVMELGDLVDYEVRDREPLVGSYRGWTVITMPPPSSGGAVILQVLGVLEGYDLSTYGRGSADLLHLQAEAWQHAFADRARFMGDPDRVEVPLEAMLAPERIAQIRTQILPGRTFEADYYGTAVDIGQDAGTQHLSVLDGEGLAVALTTTINTSFGSEVFAPASGLLLNNEMDDFVARPGEPNAYGLVGSEANAVSPGARPLSSMSPTVLVSPDGSERIVVGASGGPFIITSTLQVIVDIVDFGVDPAEAVSAPRAHHQWAPRLLFVDGDTSPDTVAQLRARGHEVKAFDFFSSVQVVHQTGEGELLGASDPRKGGWPAGVLD